MTPAEIARKFRELRTSAEFDDLIAAQTEEVLRRVPTLSKRDAEQLACELSVVAALAGANWLCMAADMYCDPETFSR